MRHSDIEKSKKMELKNWTMFFKIIHYCQRRIQKLVKYLRQGSLVKYVIGENFCRLKAKGTINDEKLNYKRLTKIKTDEH